MALLVVHNLCNAKHFGRAGATPLMDHNSVYGGILRGATGRASTGEEKAPYNAIYRASCSHGMFNYVIIRLQVAVCVTFDRCFTKFKK